MDDQDNMASIPNWYRSFIINQHGRSVMELLDDLGKFHDNDVVNYGFELANRRLRSGMKFAKMPLLTVRIPISIGIFLYRIAPHGLKDKYFKLIEK